MKALNVLKPVVTDGPLYEGVSMTPDEYMRLETDGHRYEMEHGVLSRVPSPEFKHGEAAHYFEVELGLYLRRHRAGKAVHEIDVALPDGGDVVCPDLSFIARERLEIIRKKIHGAPDLVLEVHSPRTRKHDRGEKAERYLSCGVREYWLIDPARETVELWVPASNVRGRPFWERRQGGLLESRLLPGFRIVASDLFAAN